VTADVIEELERHFGYDQRVELTVTAAFYAMVPRVLDALGVPVEGTEPEAAAAAADGDRPALAEGNV
jgi:hypothetical protein